MDIGKGALLTVRFLATFLAVFASAMISTWIVPMRAELMSEIAKLGGSFMTLTMLNHAVTALVLFLFLNARRRAAGGSPSASRPCYGEFSTS